MDAMSCSNRFGASLPTRVLRKLRSIANNWEAFATESLGRPVTLAGSNVLPGADSQARLLVNGTQTTVGSRLRFSGLP